MNDIKRCPKFNGEELEALIEGVTKHVNVITMKLSNNITAEDKRQAWEDITRTVNSVREDVVRTREKVEEKWSYLKSEAKKSYQAWKRESIKTGGGENPIPPISDRYLRVISMMPTECIDGLHGCESGQRKRRGDEGTMLLTNSKRHNPGASTDTSEMTTDQSSPAISQDANANDNTETSTTVPVEQAVVLLQQQTNELLAKMLASQIKMATSLERLATSVEAFVRKAED